MSSSRKNTCIDCGKPIYKTSTRCKSCSNTHRTGKYAWSKEARERRMGEKNHMWQGDKVGYFAVHEWITLRKPKPKLCERCKKKAPMDLASISGAYTRDVNDYEWLCRGCHMRDDGRINNLWRGKRVLS